MVRLLRSSATASWSARERRSSTRARS